MDLEKIWAGAFAAARQLSQDPDARYVVLVKPDRTILAVACPPAGSIPEEEAAKVGAILPNDVPRNVTVIAPTEFEPGPSTLAAAAEAIPFFGLLMKMAYGGHSVVQFDGQITALNAACKDADLLLIDSALANKLTTKHVEQAALVMRNVNVLIHDREKYSLRVVRKVGTSAGLEFR